MQCFFCRKTISSGTTAPTGDACRWCYNILVRGQSSDDPDAVKEAAYGLARAFGEAYVYTSSDGASVVYRSPLTRHQPSWTVVRLNEHAVEERRVIELGDGHD